MYIGSTDAGTKSQAWGQDHGPSTNRVSIWKGERKVAAQVHLLIISFQLD